MMRIVLILFFGFWGGAPLSAFSLDDRKIAVVTSFYPAYIMALNVAGDIPGVSVENMASSATGCPHDYSLTADDMKKISRADIFVVNGAGMESYLQDVIAKNNRLKIIVLSDGIALLEHNGEKNPHLWVSISNAIEQVKNLGKALSDMDADHAQLYQKNTNIYVEKLEKLKEKMHAALASYRGEQIVTFHEAFPYFAREFGFRVVAVIEREPGSQPSARELADTIDAVKKNKVRIIFSEPQYPAAAAHLIANETDATVYVLDPAVSGPADRNAYCTIMEKNCAVLEKAFSESLVQKE
ncbi:MAG TPA: metal ABC transporter substrate-binding protein [Candidatus Omnitrophota bacterium]|nr:metal ABC transporter substrate-binding protein [Candidatus Omnitrophota bacterium]